MTEEPVIIQMNIARYGAMLKRDIDGEKRSVVKRLLTEAKRNLVLATASSFTRLPGECATPFRPAPRMERNAALLRYGAWVEQAETHWWVR